MASGIGQQLREARYDKGMTLSDAAAQTGVRETHLLALERDELEAIGVDPVYVRGILRTYAEYLELDVAALLAQYGRGTEPAKAAGQDVQSAAAAVGGARRPSRRQIGAIAGAILMIVTVAGATLAVLTLRGASRDGAVVGSGSEQSETTTVTASEAPAAAASEGGGAAASEAESENVNVLDVPPGPTPEGLTMKLEFTDEVWIRVLVDGENKLEGIMRPGAVTQFTGKDEIALRIGVAAAVEFSLNGAWYGNIASGIDGPVDVLCTPETSCRVTARG